MTDPFAVSQARINFWLSVVEPLKILEPTNQKGRAFVCIGEGRELKIERVTASGFFYREIMTHQMPQPVTGITTDDARITLAHRLASLYPFMTVSMVA